MEGKRIAMFEWSYWTSAETITAYSTLLLVLVTGALVLATWKYVKEVRGQATDMRDQANAMKSQAETMEKQSRLMIENIEHDRLIRKYERLNKEITELVAPLLSKKDEYLIFGSAGDYGSSNLDANEKHKVFWDNVKEKMYLADNALASELHNYFLAMETFKNSGYTNAYAERSEDAKNAFKAEKDKLIRQIEISYADLLQNLHRTETELKIR
jgi:hypothetical protein